MAAKNTYLSILICSIYLVRGEINPVPFITKCRNNDVKCITKSSQDAVSTFSEGIPKFNVEKLDPVFVQYLDASSSQLKLYTKDFKVSGLKGCQFKKMNRDTRNKIILNLICNLELYGQYEMDGNILLLKVQGKGDFYVNAEFNFDMEFDLSEFIGKDGEKYWRVVKWTYVFKVPEKSTLRLENLFNGNEILGQAARSLFDTNASDVIEEIGGPIVEYIVKHIIVTNANNFFKHVPVKYLAID